MERRKCGERRKAHNPKHTFLVKHSQFHWYGLVWLPIKLAYCIYWFQHCGKQQAEGRGLQEHPARVLSFNQMQTPNSMDDISQLRDNYPRETAKATKGLEVRSSPLVKLSTWTQFSWAAKLKGRQDPKVRDDCYVVTVKAWYVLLTVFCLFSFPQNIKMTT